MGEALANTPPWIYVDDAIGEDHPCSNDQRKIKEACGDEKDWKKNNCQGLELKPCNRPKKSIGDIKGIKDRITYILGEIPENISKIKAPKKYKDALEAFKKEVEEIDTENPKSSKISSQLADQQTELAKESPCLRARKCKLVPFKPDTGCCPGQTGHHVIPNSFMFNGAVEIKIEVDGKEKKVPGKKRCDAYSEDKALTICVEGANQRDGSHGKIHKILDNELKTTTVGSLISYVKARNAGIESIKKTFPLSDCNPLCLANQLDDNYKECKEKELQYKVISSKKSKGLKKC